MAIKRVVPKAIQEGEIEKWANSGHGLEDGLAYWMNKAWDFEQQLAAIQREVRPELREFAQTMELKLRLHDTDRGESWKDPHLDIMARFRQEVLEAQAPDSDPTEWADVANFAFFQWYRKKHFKPPLTPLYPRR